MAEIANPFRGLVEGRLLTYFDEAFQNYARGKVRGAYDYCMLAFNSTAFELKPRGRDEPLFAWLDALVKDGKLGADVAEAARGEDFLVRHDRGITDMDLTYMSVDDFAALVRFLERFYGSLRRHGVAFGGDPRGM